MNPMSTPKPAGLQSRAFSISGGSGLNRFNPELIRMPPKPKKSDMSLNPLLSYSLNHQSNMVPAPTKKEEVKNPFDIGNS